jgi:DNA-binding CsgD family transcriptional regulator
MLQTLRLGPIRDGAPSPLPPFLMPLVTAAQRGRDVREEIESITRQLGFDTFFYAVSTCPRLEHEGSIYLYTTQTPEWVARYDQRAYVEIDPRVVDCWDRTAPLIWDQSTMRGRSAKTDAFLDDALRHGVASGILVPSRDSFGMRMLVNFNSPIPNPDALRQRAIALRLGDILTFATYFHELFVKSVVSRGLPPRSAGAPLSGRERACLVLAARGLTSDDIAKEFGISPRTVQFHFDSIRSKLLASNRQEAIAKAVEAGQIALEQPPWALNRRSEDAPISAALPPRTSKAGNARLPRR